MTEHRRLAQVPSVLTLWLTCVAGAAAGVSTTEGVRTTLAASELLDRGAVAVGIVDNGAFLPAGDEAPARHELSGLLTVPRTAVRVSEARYATYRFFPGFAVPFVSHDGSLIPAVRTLITRPGNWSLILSPGRVWSEPGDGDMSRASFPFTLGSPPDRPYTAGEAHNGVATFLYDGTTVSPLRLQVTQETAPDGDILDLWGQVPMAYVPGPVTDRAGLVAAFEREVADQIPIQPWSALGERFDLAALDQLTEGLPPASVSAAGLVIDGVVYLQPSRTRHGDYPYPRQMLHAGMSISKSIGAGIAMLWLAQEYGQDVVDLRIVDHLDVTADHDGWADVTFGDVLNMATGVGDNAPTLRPFDVYANETGDNYRRFYLAPTAATKLDAAYGLVDYPWGPGELLRYTSAQTFVLSAAVDAFLETREGRDAHLWERLRAEVFEPIGVHHLTMMHVADDEGPGVPLMSSGLRLTVDDLGKIATLLQDGGAHDGRQLLHAGLLADALHRSGQLVGLPSGKTFDDGDQGYHLSFWSLPYRTTDGRFFQVPFMSGAGGSTVFLAPNDVTTFVFTDIGQDSYSLSSPAVAEAVAPYPGAGLDRIDLGVDGDDPRRTAATVVLVLVAGVLATLVVRRRKRTRSPSVLASAVGDAAERKATR